MTPCCRSTAAYTQLRLPTLRCPAPPPAGLPTLPPLLPQVLPSERIAAAQQLPALEARLREELLADGIDPDAAAQVGADMEGSRSVIAGSQGGELLYLPSSGAPVAVPGWVGRLTRSQNDKVADMGQTWDNHRTSLAHATPAQVEDDSLLDAQEIPETGYVDESGQLRRPWCPATRILDHREAAAEAAAAEEKRRAAQTLGRDGLGLEAPEPPPHTCFPEVKEGEPLYQKNEGAQRWWWWHRLCLLRELVRCARHVRLAPGVRVRGGLARLGEAGLEEG